MTLVLIGGCSLFFGGLNPKNGGMDKQVPGYIYIPGSSKCVKCVPFHKRNLPKGRHFTYLEDPGIYIYLYLVYLVWMLI